jgi:hypothetical protein
VKAQFILDGEAVVLGVDGISDFNALHSRKVDHEVQLMRPAAWGLRVWFRSIVSAPAGVITGSR